MFELFPTRIQKIQKSAPIVGIYLLSNLLFISLVNKHVFPTSQSPTNTILKTIFSQISSEVRSRS